MTHSRPRLPGALPQRGRPASGRGWASLRRLRAWLGLSPNAPARHADSHRVTSIDDRAAFREGDEFLQRCRDDRVPVTVLVYELHDLPELECVFGAGAARNAIEQATARLHRIAGSEGRVLRTDPTLFTLLLPDTDKEDALDMLRAAFGESCSLELETGDEDLVLVPEFALRILSTEALPLVDVQHGLCCEIQQARTRERQRREYLQRERESHSRPMPLPRALQAHSERASPRAVQAEQYPRIPMTMPLPLARR